MTVETTPTITKVKLRRYEDGGDILAFKSIHLDDLVHSLAAASASALNNRGLTAQIEYIVEQLGEEQALATLERIIGPA